MEALQKENLSSDSEDEDYVPPEEKAPTLSLRKRSGGLELESDDDDEDDDDLSDDADIVDAEVAQLYATADGAGPSSAGAGPSSAGAGPASAEAGPGSAAGPSSEGAGSSALNAGAGSSAVGSSAVGEAGAGSSAAAGSSVGSGTAIKAGASSAGDGSVAEGSNGPAGSSAAASSAAKVPRKGVETGVNGAPSAKVEEPIAKKPRVEPPSEKKSIDDIWADMNAGVTRVKQQTTTPDAGLAAWLQPSPPPKKEFKVTRLSDLEKAVQQEEPVTKKKGRTGLEGVLNVVRGKSETVIEKTKEQWKEFKKDEDVKDELEKYKKDKDRYTDKVAFLQRADVKEWEYEQRGKRRR